MRMVRVGGRWQESDPMIRDGERDGTIPDCGGGHPG